MTTDLSTEGLARFDAVASGHLGPDAVPGLVALVARGQQVHVTALGSLAIGGPPARRDSLFRIASTTKPITGAAALTLVAEGRIDMDEPIDRWLPELARPNVLRRIDGALDDVVPVQHPITLRHLLTFTMGFGMTADMFMAAEPWPIVAAAARHHLATLGPPAPDEQPDPDTWISALGSLPLMAQPGERWLYNTSASVLGVLLARVAGKPLAEVLRTRVFEPLGMTDTGFWSPATERLATAYVPTPHGLQVWDRPEGQWNRPPAFGDGAAGLVSTVDDLLAFARMLLRRGDPLLPEELVGQMTSDQLTPEQRTRDTKGFLEGGSWGFCQSVLTEGPHAGAYGWDGGLGTSWLVDPARDLVVVVLTQRLFEMARAPAVHTDLQAAAYAAAAG
ncbi:MAG TPA: serine hydrolase domain-containing protein [Acidimicrobiales bacterium]|nr:serine hydrolase domain-containing protein [Acidimicrobiales bacterium]